jgi:hypothetical protein
MAERLSTLRAVDKAGSLAAHPRSIGGGRITGTGDQGALNDAVGVVFDTACLLPHQQGISHKVLSRNSFQNHGFITWQLETSFETIEVRRGKMLAMIPGQKKRLLTAKIAVALQNKLGEGLRTPTAST